MKQNHDNFLFHYCTYETAINYILPRQQLLLNPLKLTNDPRENGNLIFGARTLQGNQEPTPDETLKMSERVTQIARNDCKVLCFSSQGELEGYQLSQMWAQYGEKHHGVCIAIDRDKFVEENKKYINSHFFGKVRYVSPEKLSRTNILKRYRHVDMQLYNEINTSEAYIKNDFRITNMDYLFFTKSIEWEHEQECRLIHFSSVTENEYCSIKNSLWSVFLGVDFEESKVQTLKKYVNENCKIWQLYFSGEWLSCREVN